ncbi:M23 family metallopeptidase [Jiangella asiatica]|uniref:M23 family metallopeptidase n=1 Tax=Jiangella asiatica TaxID=2530372 RepID=UPI0013A5E1F2|nr:M23 family metallopeptidase [Jiangella asiatica]
MRKRSLGAIMTAAAVGCVTWGVPSSTVATPAASTGTTSIGTDASDIRGQASLLPADGQVPSVEEAATDLEAAQAEFEAAQQTEQEAQQRAEAASQASLDAATAAREAVARAERARGQVTDAEQAAEQARRSLGQLAANAYMNNSELGSLVQLGAADPTEFQSQSTGINELMRVQETMIRQAAESQAEATNAADRANGHVKAADEAAAAAAELSEQADAALAEAESATQQASEVLREVRDIHEAAQRAAEERAEAENQPDRGDGDDGGTDTPPPTGDGTFARPSTGPITSPYGMRVHPVTGVYKLHSGTDFGASCGSGVHAAYPGTIESTGYEGAYGNQITISHGTIGGMEVTTTYNHLSAFSSSPGQTVAAGELIGRVGTTGSSTGCHLHFEVLVNGEFTDPMGWLS